MMSLQDTGVGMPVSLIIFLLVSASMLQIFIVLALNPDSYKRRWSISFLLFEHSPAKLEASRRATIMGLWAMWGLFAALIVANETDLWWILYIAVPAAILVYPLTYQVELRAIQAESDSDSSTSHKD